MPLNQESRSFVIIGGGLAGASAVKGIRELNRDAPILMLGIEKALPYDRPPLSKKLWFGKEKVEDIFIHDEKYYGDQGVELKRGIEVVAIDPSRKEIKDRQGAVYRFEKLLLATGGAPRILGIPGGDLDGICYYRHLGDYQRMRVAATPGKSAVIIGGGFIGSEMAAALSANYLHVSMIFPEEYLVQRVFPKSLGRAIQEEYVKHGIQIFPGDSAVSFGRTNHGFVTRTQAGRRIEADIVIVGVGIKPSIELAESAGLEVGDGIIVDEYLKSSHPDIFAAGDNTNLPCVTLGQRMRVEHWDNALNQGRQAGRNMAGAHESYSYMPYFFSDLFEFGYEAVGEVDARLETIMDWQKKNDTGIIYYIKDDRIRGAMMCNTWNKVDWARDLIRKGQHITPQNLPKAA